MSKLPPLPLPDNVSLDTREVWAALTEAHRHLAELKGLCESLPNQGILLDTLSIQEAKDSSEIENIITTHDELFAVQEQLLYARGVGDDMGARCVEWRDLAAEEKGFAVF